MRKVNPGICLDVIGDTASGRGVEKCGEVLRMGNEKVQLKCDESAG